MEKQGNWEPCPRCGSSKVTTMNGCMLSFLMMGLAGISTIIGIFLFPVLILVPVFIVLAFVSLFAKKSNYCQECKYRWKAQEKQL